jgi:hypothetical protein
MAKPFKIGRNVISGGVGSRVNREVGVRVGDRARVGNVRGVSQIGQSLGNHVTESARKGQPVENLYGAKQPAGGPGGIPLGNQKALDIGKGGVGTGRNLYGQSGTNKQYGPANPGGPGLPSTKGQWPD